LPEGSAPSAVVVDEEALLRVGIATALRPLGIRVAAETARGHEATRLVDEQGAELVVVGNPADMPRAELLGRFRERGVSPRSLVLLPQADPDELGALVALEVNGLLLRSADLDVLTRAIGQIMAGERVVDPVLLATMTDGAPPAGDDAGALVLTARERDVLALLAEGRSNREIASALFVSLPTVKTHLAHIYSKLDARNRNEALGRAVSLGLLA